jgi:hypothetical protein
LLVLFVKSYNLATFGRRPTIFGLFPAEYDELEVVCEETQAFYCACFEPYLRRFIFLELAYHPLEADYN